MISLREYVCDIDAVNYVSVSHWGMFPIIIPTFKHEVEGGDDIRQAVKEDLYFKVPHMMRRMVEFKSGVAAYANKL